MKFRSKYKNFNLWKCIWKYHLRNSGHFVEGEMSYLVSNAGHSDFGISLYVGSGSNLKFTKDVPYLKHMGDSWGVNCEYFVESWLSLTHWGRVMHICISILTIIGSDNGLLPGRHQAIIWTNAAILLIGPLGTNFSEILSKSIHFHSRKWIWKCRLENGGHLVPASMC